MEKSISERWVSGLNHQFAKLTYGITVPGVRIPLSPPSDSDMGSGMNDKRFVETTSFILE